MDIDDLPRYIHCFCERKGARIDSMSKSGAPINVALAFLVDLVDVVAYR
jgi:hypothetical protein